MGHGPTQRRGACRATFENDAPGCGSGEVNSMEVESEAARDRMKRKFMVHGPSRACVFGVCVVGLWVVAR